jgi:hypothetical protein
MIAKFPFSEVDMRKRLLVSFLLFATISLTCCKPVGIVELSREDTQRCYNILAKDGELLTNMASTLEDYSANVPEANKKLLDARTQLRGHLDDWDRLVKELYDKYQLNEESYRLDVFRGRFMRKGMK